MRRSTMLLLLGLMLSSAPAPLAAAQAICPEGQYWGNLPCVEPRPGGLAAPLPPGPVQVPAGGAPEVVPLGAGQWTVYVPIEAGTVAPSGLRIVNVPGPLGDPTPAQCLTVAQIGNTQQLQCVVPGALP